MALVPASSGTLALPSSLSQSLSALRTAFADRRLLDSAVSAQDAADWQLILGTGSGPAASAPPKGRRVKVSRSAGGKSSSGPGSMVNRQDLKIRPPSMKPPNSVPRNFLNQSFFDRYSSRTGITTSTTSNVETNYQFSLNSHPNMAALVATFDQYCVVQASVTFMSAQAPGSTAQLVEIHTAIDFDNITNVVTFTALDQYDDLRVHELGPGANRNVTRSVIPCMKLSSAAGTGATTSRQWVDCAFPLVNWFGIRSIIAPTIGAALPLIAEVTVWFAFRGRV